MLKESPTSPIVSKKTVIADAPATSVDENLVKAIATTTPIGTK